MCDYIVAVVVSQPSGSKARAVVDVWTKTSFGVLFQLIADYKSAEGSHWNKINLYEDGGVIENLYEVGDEAEVFTDGLVLGL